MRWLSYAVEIGLPFAAAIAPIVACLGWAELMESLVMPQFYPPGTPRLSYGVQMLFLLIVVIVPLGFVGSLSVALALQRCFAVAAAVCWTGAVPAILFLSFMLIGDVRRYGYEPTKLIIDPVQAASAAAILGWGCIMATAAVNRCVIERKWLA